MDNQGIVTAGQKDYFRNLDIWLKSQSLIDIDVRGLIAEHFHAAFVEAQIHHQKHILELPIDEKCREVYKTVSWHVWYLAYRLHARGEMELALGAISSGLKTLNSFLLHEAPNDACLDEPTLKLIGTMVANELETLADHGIAKNGLYLSFKAARTMKSSREFKVQSIQSSNF